jgi:hypothetical protein
VLGRAGRVRVRSASEPRRASPHVPKGVSAGGGRN